MWHSMKEEPAAHGLYLAARFEGDTLVDFAEYAYLGYWTANTLGCGIKDGPTHWMPYSEYRKLHKDLLSNIPRA